jgi:alginate O-acetyltransferase complex protein AlgI
MTDRLETRRNRYPGRLVSVLAIALPLAAIAAGPWLPPWAFMWLLAWSVFLACKLVTWHEVAGGSDVTPGRTLAYLFAWPGMDGAFLKHAPGTGRTPVSRGAIRVVTGVALIWVVARLIPADQEMLRGWVGLVAAVLLLHFGLFDLLAWFWQRRGIDAQPLMDAPARSRSLAEFWGRRWNRGFHRLAEMFVFRRMAALGTRGAMAMTFLASGLVHDLVISLPARGGYGLPTAYFLIQAIGLAVERSRIGRTVGLRRGVRGRVYTLAVITLPLPLLFHGRFVTHVFLPFMHAIGALP